MSSLDRIWNHRLVGLPGAVWLAICVIARRLADVVTTALAHGSLGSMGPNARVQAGVVIRYPGRVHLGARSSLAAGVEIATELQGSECRIGADVIVATGVRLDFSGGLNRPLKYQSTGWPL